jgi:uncharacterized protein
VRIILDTNVVASALLWGGKPAELLRATRLRHVQLFTSVWMLAELTRILGHKKFARKIEASGFNIDELVDRYVLLTTVVYPASAPRVVPADADDDHVIAAAVAAQAKMIVSGDSDLLELKHYGGIDIVTVAQALDMLGIL